MNIIEKPLFKATVAETSDLSANISSLISDYSLDDAFLNNIGQQLGELGSQMQKSIAADRKKAHTEAINISDGKRDSYISALKLFTRGHITWNNGNAASGLFIYNLIKKHGLSMTEAGLEEQNGLTESLLNDFEAPEAQAAIAAIDLSALVADLRAEQTALSQLMLEAVKIESGKEEVIAATKIKKTVHGILKQTSDYLNVMYQVNPASYKQIAEQLAELVNTLNGKIRNRYNN